MSPRLKIAVKAESLGVGIREAIPCAARLGATGVQFDAVGELAPENLSSTGRRHLRHMVHSTGLAIAALGAPTRRGYDVLERLEGRIAQTLKTLALASELGAPSIVNHIGRIPADDATDAARHFFDALDRIGREGERVGVRFAIETGVDGAARLAKLLERMNRHGLAVHYSPANLFAREHCPYDAVSILGRSIVGVEVKDVTRDGGGLAGVNETSVGDGDLDWPRILGALAEIDYPGYLTIASDRPDHRLDIVRKGIEYFSKF